jgi:hypothetical protein
MNKLSKMILGVAVSAMVLSGCKNQDVVAPTVTNPNQYPNGVIQKSITVSIQVVPSASSGSRVEGLSSAVVTISQNGSTSSKTTGADGLAIFTNLNEGSYSYYITATNYASVNGNGTAADASTALTGTTGNNTNQTIPSNNSLQVYLPKIGASIVGKFIANFSGVPTAAATAASGYRVRLKYDSNIQPNIFFATTQSDGTFQFSNLPSLDGTTFGNPTISVDTTVTLGSLSQVFAVNYSNTVVSKYGADNSIGTVTLPISGTIAIKKTGLVKGNLWGNLNLANATAQIAFNTSGFTGQLSNSTILAFISANSGNATNAALPQKISFTTDGSGNFSISGLASGNYTLTISAVLGNPNTSGPFNYQGTTPVNYSRNFNITDDSITDLGSQQIF